MPTVADLVEHLGNIVVIAEAGDLGAPVRDVVVHDPIQRVDVHAGDVVLAVGLDFRDDAFVPTCRRYAEAGAAAILVKGTGVPEWPDSPMFTVLQVPVAMEWGHLLTLLRTALSAGQRPGDGVQVAGDIENLFALTDILASRGGGPVVLHDPQWRMLAYSGGGYDIDDVGRATILGRRAPQPWLERFQLDGGMARLLAGEVVHLEGAPNPALSMRSAIAIRAGGEILGSIWLVHSDTSDVPELELMMRQIADVAALQLIRSRVTSSVAEQARSELFASLLTGGEATPEISERLGLPLSSPLLFAGFRPDIENELFRAVSVERLAATLRMVCDAYRLQTQQAVVDDTAFVLVRLASTDARPLATKVLHDVHRQVSRPSEPVHSAIGRTIGRLDQLTRPQQDVRVLLDLQAEGRLTCSGPADALNHKVMIEYERLRRVLSHHPDLIPVALERLLEGDADSVSGWLETLRAYFNAGGDVQAAGKALGLHGNTVRYRLRRISEVSGMNLDDPTERFIVELNLRLLL